MSVKQLLTNKQLYTYKGRKYNIQLLFLKMLVISKKDKEKIPKDLMKVCRFFVSFQ